MNRIHNTIWALVIATVVAGSYYVIIRHVAYPLVDAFIVNYYLTPFWSK